MHHRYDTWVCDTYSPLYYVDETIYIDSSSYVYFNAKEIHIMTETDVYLTFSCQSGSVGTHGHFAHYKTGAYYYTSVDDEAGKL